MPDFPVLLEACQINPTLDNEKAAIALSHYITNEILKKSGMNPNDLSPKEMFFALFICLNAIGQLTAETKLNFEMVSSQACLSFFLSYERNDLDGLFGRIFKGIINFNNFIATGDAPISKENKIVYKELKEPMQEITKGIKIFIESKGNKDFRDEIFTMLGSILSVCIKHV
ncbi:MAG TPA: hypothetical protein VJN02_06805 [Gammaproteobacteria bacterium]|nr:hypothetical protein [Gammaproteobacteria bacterium]